MNIDRPSIPHIIAEKIKEQITEGVFTQFLPGQQRLASIFKVSVPSIIKALVIVEREGFIEAAVRGKKRRIQPQLPRHRSETNLLVISPPIHSLTQSNIQMIKSAEQCWEDKYPNCTCVHLQRIHRPMTITELDSELKKHNIRAILVFEASQDWVETLSTVALPVYRFGGTLFDAKLGNSGFGHKVEKIISEGIEKFTSMGHTKILTPLTRPYLLEATNNIYHRLLKSSGIDPVSYCPTFPIDNPSAIPAFWEKHLTTLQPTAILSIHLPVLYSLIGFCNVARISIPDNLSVVSLMNHNMIDYFTPKIVAPKIKQYERIQLFKSWLDSDFQEQGFKHLPLYLSDGESIAKI